MKVIGIVVEREAPEIAPELVESFNKLEKYLKEKHGLELLGEQINNVLTLFDDVFRPLLLEYQNGRTEEADVAVKLLEYDERLTMLLSLGKYASSTHKVDISEGPIAYFLRDNLTMVSGKIQEMLHKGKSYEDAYRYLRSNSVLYHLAQGQVH